MRPAYLPLSAPVAGYEPPTPPDLAQYSTVFIDCETTGLDWARGDRPVGIAVGTPDGQRWYLPFGHRAGGNLDEDTVRSWALRELRSKKIVGLNLKFDLHMLRVWGVELRGMGGTFHDIAHAEALLDDHARGFSLEAIAQRRLGLGKLPSGPKSNIANEHASLIAPYAERDVQLPAEIDAVQRPLLADEGLDRVMALEDALIPVVVEMEMNGLPLDMPLLERWERETKRIVEKLQWALHREVGFVVNPDSPTDMLRLFLRCGEPVHRTLSGRPSFTAEIVKAAAVRHKAIELAYQIGKVNDLRSKSFVKYLKDQIGGVLYPSFHQLRADDGGAVTGRFSSSRPNGQNIQGADKHTREYAFLAQFGDDFLVRRLFVPRRGAWMCADQAQVEYRIAAAYSKAPKILKAYADDPTTDFHEIVGQLLRPARPNITRTEIKTANFLTLYGGGVGTLAAKLGVEHDVAQEIASAYDAMFPELKDLLNRAKRLAEQRGYVKTWLGRRSRFPERDRTFKALNSVVQGGAADANKMTLVEIYKERKALGLTMRATVHDELDGDLEGPVEPVAEILNTQMTGLAVPILWQVGTGANWAAAK